jgi:hypothetical protein
MRGGGRRKASGKIHFSFAAVAFLRLNMSDVSLFTTLQNDDDFYNEFNLFARFLNHKN